MKKLLVLFAKEFPYGVSEPFLELEYPLYKKYFDKVLIVTNKAKSKTIRGKKTREILEPDIEILSSEFNKDFFTIAKLIFSVISDVNFYKELLIVCKSHKNIFNKIKDLFSVIGKANLCIQLAHKRVVELENEGYQVKAAYGYWLLYPAYAAVKFSKKYYKGSLYTISRAHRFDLYEYRNKYHFLPCRKYILTGLSEIASISEDGKRYLTATYPSIDMNISIRRLGAKDVGQMQIIGNDSAVFRIVSCARVVPVKRIDRIIEALRQIDDIEIEWTHIGGGDLLENIKSQAKNLPDNIKCIFTGTISNTEVYQRYVENKYQVFVNVSESEGVPVSIMEAMCFGTPVVATDVGGVKEMINVGENGFLLGEKFSPEELVQFLRKIRTVDNRKYIEMRKAARKVFETKYNATLNYDTFLQDLSNH